ncbi:metallophosphoesterase family protein [Leuconostoc holzapfelii]|uniref:metallophosphoesterase family protein n=1 Tax=Leuconostoc holzapfelii TaxID=434464 RepID=UPI0021C01622|nr:metallophosphoesterase family protein [Leuconostoc holzapfelii]
MQQKIGVLADVHGNLTALEAVIADAKNLGVTEFWSLGDIATYGPNTVTSYRLLHQENTTVFLQGNWESSYQEYERATTVDLDDAAEVAFLN